MKERYISRVDSVKSGMYGYLLRLYRDRGVLFQQWFPDKNYGGREQSLREAIRVRDQKMQEYNYKPGGIYAPRTWRPVLMERKPNSNTGILGIYESGYKKQRKDGEWMHYRYFAVSYVVEKGHSRMKRFYINSKQNREEALQKAVAFRKQKEISARLAAVEYNRKLLKEQIERENRKHKRRAQNKPDGDGS